MAIALPYYFGLTNLSNSVVADAWYEPAASASGNFLLNITGSIKRQLQIDSPDFTLICTIDHFKSPQNTGAVEILAGSGWTFGIDNSNSFFVQSTIGEAYTFNQINLGKKNCFALTKDGLSFNVTSFNVPSQAVEASQTEFFSPINIMTGTGLYFAGGNPISGVKNFYGTVDQLFLTREPLSTKNIETLFSGFLRQTVIYIPLSNTWQLTYSTWGQTGTVAASTIQFLQSGAQFFSQDIFSYLTTNVKPYGGYYGQMLIEGTPAKTEYSRINPTGFVNPCTTLGTTQIGTHSMGNFGIADVSAPVLINYQNPNTLLSFDLSSVQPGMTLDLTYTLTAGQSAFVSQNTGYYTGFVMNGANAPNAKQLKIGYYPTNMANISQLGSFDPVTNKYYTPGNVSGNLIYADGVPVSYIQSGDYAAINQQNIKQLIYDKTDDSSFVTLHSNNQNFATGTYFAKRSAAFTGVGWTMRTIDYLETHQYHLYYGKDTVNATGALVYNNSDENWL